MRRCQSAWLMTATASAPARSSPSAKYRPITGVMPSVRKKSALTSTPAIRSGSARPARVKRRLRNSATERKTPPSFRQSMKFR